MTARPVWPVIVIGAIVILVVDTGAGYVSKTGVFSDQWFLIPTVITYAATGFAAGWRRSIAAGAVAGTLISLLDVTLGWWIVWLIDPAGNQIKTTEEVMAVVPVVHLGLALGAAFGTGAAFIARRIVTLREERRRPAG